VMLTVPTSSACERLGRLVSLLCLSNGLPLPPNFYENADVVLRPPLRPGVVRGMLLRFFSPTPVGFFLYRYLRCIETEAQVDFSRLSDFASAPLGRDGPTSPGSSLFWSTVSSAGARPGFAFGAAHKPPSVLSRMPLSFSPFLLALPITFHRAAVPFLCAPPSQQDTFFTCFASRISHKQTTPEATRRLEFVPRVEGVFSASLV